MITIKEVALAAGVSTSTVSRALSGNKRVNADTRKLIEGLAQELNYSPNYSAKALHGKSTNLIGLIVPEIISNYYGQIIDYVDTALYQMGFALIVGTTGWDKSKGLKNLDVFIKRGVDGIIYADDLPENYGTIFRDADKKPGIPLVLLGRTGGPQKQESVIVDERYGISLLIEHLVSLGHRDIGFIGEDISSSVRLPLFHAALAQSGLSCNENHVKAVGKERFESGGYLRMKELLAEKTRPTAVFASYDYLAIGALHAANEAGLRVPEDISIVGFDNVRGSEHLIPPLTTVYPPIMEMAERAVNTLISKIQNEDIRNRPNATTTLYPELIVRQSSGKPL